MHDQSHLFFRSIESWSKDQDQKGSCSNSLSLPKLTGHVSYNLQSLVGLKIKMHTADIQVVQFLISTKYWVTFTTCQDVLGRLLDWLTAQMTRLQATVIWILITFSIFIFFYFFFSNFGILSKWLKFIRVYRRVYTLDNEIKLWEKSPKSAGPAWKLVMLSGYKNQKGDLLELQWLLVIS